MLATSKRASQIESYVGLAECNAPRYNQTRVIKSFRHKGLKRLFETGERRGVAGDLADRLRRQLDVLNRARSTRDLNLPGYRMHQLKGIAPVLGALQSAATGA